MLVGQVGAILERLGGQIQVVQGRELTVQVTRWSLFQQILQTKIWKRKSCKRVEEAEIAVKMPTCRQSSDATYNLFFSQASETKKSVKKLIKNIKMEKQKLEPVYYEVKIRFMPLSFEWYFCT